MTFHKEILTILHKDLANVFTTDEGCAEFIKKVVYIEADGNTALNNEELMKLINKYNLLSQ